MKFIFDFDGVIFLNTKKFKEHMYASLEKAGISRKIAEEYYKKVRAKQFWLKELLTYFSLKESLYEEILSESKSFTDKSLLKFIKRMGKNNCYIVTHGNEMFQNDKIKAAEIDSLFTEIVVVSGSKKDAVERICTQNKGEKVIFIDDKIEHFENLDFKKCPNLKTILYDENALEKLEAEFV